ncbi:hypothetical protein LIER_19740 [Lithospermum erythrorhizon]|uniref:Uncharacterized protein n=1 Tax=Lithospermum erythrorhizon TaxID=34254 RepID=A0AAV3QIW2_LITER
MLIRRTNVIVNIENDDILRDCQEIYETYEFEMEEYDYRLKRRIEDRNGYVAVGDKLYFLGSGDVGDQDSSVAKPTRAPPMSDFAEFRTPMVHDESVVDEI